MSKRRHPRPAVRRRAPGKLFTGNSLYRRALRYEPLEDRRLLAVVTVDTLADTVDFNDGRTSLREAIFATNTVPGADTINFALALTANGPATILLTQGELKITDALTIDGPGASLLTINATYGPSTTTGPALLFNINDGTENAIDVSFAGLRLMASNQTAFDVLVASTENLSLATSILDGNHVASNGVISSIGTLSISSSTIANNRLRGVSIDGDAIIDYSTISGNGGGVFTRGALAIDHTTVTGNQTSESGGGIYSNSGLNAANQKSLTITDSKISNNSSGREGGGVCKKFGDLTIERSTISDNKARVDGGGISDADGDSTFLIADSIVVANGFSDTSGLQWGGGIYLTVGVTNISIERSLISKNSAVDGGGIAAPFLDITVDSSTIADNSAEIGAAIHCWTLALENSTISGNISGNPSRFIPAIEFVKATVQFATITNNIGPQFTGPTQGRGQGNVCEIYSSIIAGNIGGDVNFDGRFYTSDGYNIIGIGAGITEFNQPGDEVSVTDPKLAALADNGGFVLPDGSHILTQALLAGSPAINAGDLNAVAGVNGVPQYDERGTPYSRVFGGRIDIGAFEYQQPSDLNLIVDTLVDESDGNYGHGDLSLREAIELANKYPGPNYPSVINTIHFDPVLTANGPATILLTKGDLTITHAVTIVGPGANLLTVDASGNDPTPDINDRKGSHVFSVTGPSSPDLMEVSISGLTLTGGDVQQGGAILDRFANLTLANTTISGNASVSSGGGVYVFTGNLTVTASTITGNVVTAAQGGAGGGIGVVDFSGLMPSWTVQIQDSDISGNTAPSSGGGVWINFSAGILSIDNSRISANSTSSSTGGGGGLGGGGVFVNSGVTLVSVMITNSSIDHNTCPLGNQSPGAPPSGGGLSLGNVNASIVGSSIEANSAAIGGGVSFQGVGNNQPGNLSISNSTISGNSASVVGAGLRVSMQQGSFLLVGDAIENNVMTGTGPVTKGGGIYASSTNIATTITDTAINNNKAASGGGIWISGVLALTNSVVSNNSATTGGGIFASSENSTVMLTGAQVTHNSATLDGGGIEREGGTNTAIVLRTSALSFNSAGRDGGGLNATSSTYNAAKFDTVTIEGNSAGGSGGGLSKHGAGSISVGSSTISGNTASGDGGGVAGDGSSVFLYQSTLTGNSAGALGGGAWSSRGELFKFATVTSNRAGAAGGGLFSSYGPISLSNTIVAGNTAPAGRDLTGLIGVTISANYSLVGSNAGSGLAEAPLGSPDANGNLVGGPVHGIIDPKLGPLAMNGGVTATQVPLAGSPVLNAGDPSAGQVPYVAPFTDQRGGPFARVYGGRIDIGAVESQPNPLPGDFNFNGVVDMADYVVWRKVHTTFDPRADANGDGRVDDADLAVWRSNFGQTYASRELLTATAAVSQSLSKPPSMMMADVAAAEPAPKRNHASTGFLARAVESPVTAKRIWSLTASNESGSFNQLLTLVAADRFGGRRSDASAELSDLPARDGKTDAADDAVAAFDEAFATLDSAAQ